MSEIVEIVKCLCCKKDIKQDEHGCLREAGFVELSFHYGSRYDQCKGFTVLSDPPADGTKIEKLVCCDIIEAYICDDCFESNLDLIKGFKVRKTVDRKQIV